MARVACLVVLVAFASVLVGAHAQGTCADAFINEIHYDNTGGDMNEGIEVVYPSSVAPASIQLVLYNGGDSSSTAEKAVTYGSAMNLTSGSSVGTTGFSVGSITYPANGIQNGPSDGVALVCDGSVIQLLSYEGNLTASNGPAAGLTSTDIGVFEAGLSGNLATQSLQLKGNGSRYSDFTWANDTTSSFGAINDGQSLTAAATAVPAPPPVTAAPTAAATCADAFINEIHYNNVGTDSGEAVEVIFPTSVAGNLSLVLYNGGNTPTDARTYGTLSISNGTALGATGFSIASVPAIGLQNGPNDGLALVCGGSAVELLSYQGVLTAGNGPAAGMNSTDIGVTELGGDDNPAGTSLQLKGTGTKASDFTWSNDTASSFGVINDGQTFRGVGPAPSPPPSPPPPPSTLCSATATPIHQVQGSGATSPLAGSKVAVAGIVTASFQGNNTVGIGGFFIQSPDASADANPATSEGLFVYDGLTPAVKVSAGDSIAAMGTVVEFNGLTELGSVTEVAICSSDNPLPAATALTLPAMMDKNATLEPLEGMLVKVAGPLTVTNNYDLAQFGEITLSAAGRVYTGTQVATPGAAAAAVDAAARTIVLDDGRGSSHPAVIPYPPPELAYNNSLRTGATTGSVTGVLTYTFNDWYIQPTVVPGFDLAANARTPPPDVGGRARISSFNGTGFNNGSSIDRGAQTAEEFSRQRAKIISAITTISPDVLGLTEVENNGYGPNSAIQDLVSGLNAVAGAGTYAFRVVPGRAGDGVVGTDVISVKFVYKPATFEPVGPTAILDSQADPRFIDTRNRPTLIQQWRERSSGGSFVFAINHLKSKGSSCGSGDDTTDGSGNCAGTRDMATLALRDYLANNTGNFSDSKDIILMGDFNAYYHEQALQNLYDANYTNLESDKSWSYQFSGAFGSLDHAIANPGMRSQITAAQAWHLNSDEPVALDYNLDDGRSARQDALDYNPGPYRSSDHDSVLVGINLTPDTTMATAPPPVKAASPPPLKSSPPPPKKRTPSPPPPPPSKKPSPPPPPPSKKRSPPPPPPAKKRSPPPPPPSKKRSPPPPPPAKKRSPPPPPPSKKRSPPPPPPAKKRSPPPPPPSKKRSPPPPPPRKQRSPPPPPPTCKRAQNKCSVACAREDVRCTRGCNTAINYKCKNKAYCDKRSRKYYAKDCAKCNADERAKCRENTCEKAQDKCFKSCDKAFNKCSKKGRKM